MVKLSDGFTLVKLMAKTYTFPFIPATGVPFLTYHATIWQNALSIKFITQLKELRMSVTIIIIHKGEIPTISVLSNATSRNKRKLKITFGKTLLLFIAG